MFFVSFFDSEVQEVVPLMQEEPHDVGWYDTRRHEKITFNSILCLNNLGKIPTTFDFGRAEIGFPDIKRWIQ